jgi:hypothetical protein
MLDNLARTLFASNNNHRHTSLKLVYLRMLHKYLINHLTVKQDQKLLVNINKLFKTQIEFFIGLDVVSQSYRPEILTLIVDYVHKFQANYFSINEDLNLYFLLNMNLMQETIYKYCIHNLDFLVGFDSTCFTRFSDIMAKIKLNKNYIEHMQTCLRTRHQACKLTNDALTSNKHNGITTTSTCLLKSILFELILSMRVTHNDDKLLLLANQIGICTCCDLYELVDFVDSNRIDVDLISHMLYDFLMYTTNFYTFNLNQTNDYEDTLVAKIIKVICEYNRKSLVIVRMLTNTIYKLNKLTYAKHINLIKIVFRVADLCLGTMSCANDDDRLGVKRLVYECLCKYTNQFLTVFNSSQLSIGRGGDVGPIGQQQARVNLNNYLLSFYNENLMKLFNTQIDLNRTDTFKSPENHMQIISICSQLILYQEIFYVNLNSVKVNQTHLCALFVEFVRDTSLSTLCAPIGFNVYGNERFLQILLDLYWRCSMMRHYFNDMDDDFDANLLAIFQGSFKPNENFNVLELIADILLTHYCYNRKVSMFYIVSLQNLSAYET